MKKILYELHYLNPRIKIKNGLRRAQCPISPKGVFHKPYGRIKKRDPEIGNRTHNSNKRNAGIKTFNFIDESFPFINFYFTFVINTDQYI